MKTMYVSGVPLRNLLKKVNAITLNETANFGAYKCCGYIITAEWDNQAKKYKYTREK